MKMKKQLDIKKLLLLNMPYILMGLFATNFGEGWRMAVGADASAKMLSFFSTLPVALASWWPSLHPLDLLVGLCCGAGLRLAVYLKSKNAKKYRHGMEYGSARWGTHEDIAPYIDPVFQNNVILTKTESLTMNSRPKDPKTARNKNVLVIGGSGSGKTRFWLKPNLMQMHSSYVVTDPKGTILVECGKMLQRGTPKLGKDGKPMKDKHGKVIYEPYRIKVLNTINFKKSMHYNPFAYIHSEKDILKLVTTLIANTKGEGKAGDDFWVKAETLLYCALIGYIHYEAPVEEQNFSTLIEFINAMEVREDDEEFKNPVDLMFDALEAEKPNHFAVRQYKKYKLAAGKTAKSILISCGARLAVFDIAELREVISYDELELDTLGDRRTALFLIMSDTDDAVEGLPTYVFVMLGLYAGLRREEILALKWDSVYLDGNFPYLTVRRAWHTENNRPVILEELKTKAAERNIPLPTCLAECLKETKENSTSEYVVPNRDGDPLSYTQFKRLWQYVVTRTVKERSYYRYEDGKRVKHTVTPVLGEKAAHNGNVVYSLDFEVTPHQLRHTYITNLIHSSVDPKTVQYLAGHESSKITMDIYAKVKYNRPDELVRTMGNAFSQWDSV